MQLYISKFEKIPIDYINKDRAKQRQSAKSECGAWQK